MTNTDSLQLRPLLDRLTRLSAADAWADHLTPTQMAALDYLNRANRYSRAPSQVADYLGATRGTVSQTLRTLERKGLIEEQRSTEDKRRISYDITADGQAATGSCDGLDAAVSALPEDDRKALTQGMRALLTEMVTKRGARPFGFCRDCRHHVTGTGGKARCALLGVALALDEAGQICHEQTPV
ncbi:MarR family winged helix-turn-helix transcriptional regulator [Roseovarius sp. 2305UL8-3]|uniref:MarR family winged helix-turn-helix transcriptional regulator n=1 Tax=Roseovarius conchicola TaxID=3121636 RepID=UPI00352991B1